MKAALDRVLADARFSLRLLRRTPVFGLTLVTILVAGIGATTAMFSIVMALLVRPLPFPHPGELTMVWTHQPRLTETPFSMPDFADIKARSTTLAKVALVEDRGLSISGDGRTAAVLATSMVTGEFFSLIDLPPLRGRLLGPDDDRIGAPRSCVISAKLWRERLGGGDVIGRTIVLDSEPWTVVGIAAEGFTFASPRGANVDLWVPMARGEPLYARLIEPSGRGWHFASVIARRKPGVTLAAAQAELTGIGQSLEKAYPETNTGVGFDVGDLQDAVVGPARSNVWILFGAVAVVFLVMCANVANLLLACAASRRAEMAARAALGATPGRLVAQLVTETATIFVVAALGGTLLARWLVGFFGRGIVTASGIAPTDAPVEWTALAFAIGIALVCGIVAGLVPAFEAMRVSPQAVLKEAGSRSATGGLRRVRGGLVVVQVALAFALLAASGSAVRAFVKITSAPLGIEPADVATFSLQLPVTRYKDDRSPAFWQTLVQRFRAEPGVVEAGAASSIPLGHSNSNSSFRIEGKPEPGPSNRPHFGRQEVTPSYFATMGIPLLRGRLLADTDVKESRPVIVISRRAAEQYFPGEDALGHRIDFGDSDEDDGHNWREIVGIVGDVNHLDFRTPVIPESYAPVAQFPAQRMFLVVKTRSADALLREAGRIVGSIDPELGVSSPHTMQWRLDGSLASQRFSTALLAGFAIAGLVLATLGIFGLVSYTTSQRTRELGIRLALGSPPRGVLAVVMREGMTLLGVGLGVGLVAALLVGRELAERVREAVAFDPLVVGGIVGVLGIAGTVASLLPALRAIRIPPAVALRYE